MHRCASAKRPAGSISTHSHPPYPQPDREENPPTEEEFYSFKGEEDPPKKKCIPNRQK
jgi:hypothetical protein